MRGEKPYFVISGLIFLGILSLNDYLATGNDIFLSVLGATIFNLTITIFTDYFDPLRVQEAPTVKNILEKMFSNTLKKLYNWFWALVGIGLGLTGGGIPGLMIGLLFGILVPDFKRPKMRDLSGLWISWSKEIAENYDQIHPIYFIVVLVGFSQFFRQLSRVTAMPEMGLGVVESIAYISPISVSIGFMLYGMLKLTNYVFNSERTHVIDTAQIFGILAYLHPLVFVLLLLSGLENNYSTIYALKVISILGPLMALPMWYLLPYYRGDERLERNIRFLKAFKENGEYSKEDIVNKTGISNNKVEEMLEVYSGNTFLNFRPLKMENEKYSRKEPKNFLMDLSN